MLDYQYFKDHYQLIAVDLRKERELDVDPRAIRQIEFYGMLDTKSQVCTFYKRQKKQYWNFTKEQQKFCEHINGWIQQSKC